MRISHFCFSLDPSRGGVSSGVITTVQQLTKFGIENQIFSFGNTKFQIEKNFYVVSSLNSIGVDYRFTIAKFRNDYGIGSLKGLTQILSKMSKPNLVVLHQIYTFSTLIGYIYAKRFGIPYVVMPHGSLTKYHESDSRLIKTLAKWIFITKILHEASAIVVTCESEKTDLNPPLQAKALQLNYGAAITQSLNENARRHPMDNKNPHIIFCGRFDKKKNLPLVIKALPLVLDKYPGLVLDIAGSGTAKEVRKLHGLIESLKLEGSIQFHGWVNATKMLELLSRARLLVLPSENENFAIVVAEALGAGVPCVLSKFVGTAEIISKHNAGEIIQELTPTAVADGILKVLHGDETKYREAAFEAVQKSLDWSKIAQQWKALIASLA